MKVQRHMDGTYSITGMTSGDIRNLAFGASSANTWYALHHGAVDDTEWENDREAMYDRLYTVLNSAADARHHGHIEVVEDRLENRKKTYRVVKSTGMKGWEGQEPYLPIEIWEHSVDSADR